MDVLDFSQRTGPGRIPLLGIPIKTVAKIFFDIFSLVYGLICFAVLASQAIYQGSYKELPTKALWDRVEQERTRIWSLSTPGKGFKHDFFVNRAGHSTHYLVLGDASPAVDKTKTLVIFIHGWPDCGHMWSTVAEELATTRSFQSGKSTKVLAVDMPGYGGSDSLPGYGPEQVLGTLVQFVAGMRARHLPKGKGRVVIAAHDWGGVVAWRLAAEAPEVADRFVIANGPPTFLAKQNSAARLALCRAHLRCFNLRAARTAIAPAIRQLGNSHYIFIFALPALLSDLAFRLGGHFFSWYVAAIGVAGDKGMRDPAWHKKAKGAATTPLEDAMAVNLAGSFGPNAAALRTSFPGKPGADSAATYAPSVGTRCGAANGRGNVSRDSIRYYQDGLASGAWRFDADTLAATLRLRSDRGLSGQPDAWAADARRGLRSPAMPKAPVTIAWGALDPAMDRALMLDGVEDWVGGARNIVDIPGAAHWVPTERAPGGAVGEGQRVLARCVAEAVDGRN